MPGLNCEKLSCVKQLCQSRNVKSRKVQVKMCPTKVGEDHFWSHRPFAKAMVYFQLGVYFSNFLYSVFFASFYRNL